MAYFWLQRHYQISTFLIYIDKYFEMQVWCIFETITCLQTKVQQKIKIIVIFIFTLFFFTYLLSPGIKTKLRQLFSQNVLWDNSFNVGCLSKVFEHIEFIIMEPQVVNLI